VPEEVLYRVLLCQGFWATAEACLGWEGMQLLSCLWQWVIVKERFCLQVLLVWFFVEVRLAFGIPSVQRAFALASQAIQRRFQKWHAKLNPYSLKGMLGSGYKRCWGGKLWLTGGSSIFLVMGCFIGIVLSEYPHIQLLIFDTSFISLPCR
jgi:hypothetical protein